MDESLGFARLHGDYWCCRTCVEICAEQQISGEQRQVKLDKLTETAIEDLIEATRQRRFPSGIGHSLDIEWREIRDSIMRVLFQIEADETERRLHAENVRDL